jgi:lysine-N-methylase
MSILHQSRTYPALLPRYVSRFSCIGSECEDNCCTGWRVSIDKKTFNAYRQTEEAELNALLAGNVKRQRSQASDANYARIELKAGTQQCPILDDRLCSVQKKMGESFLSDTCFSYPRQSRNFGGQYEQALTLSCPEAARQALLQADAFDFMEGTITVRTNGVNTVKPKQGIPLELMNQVRIFCLKLVRTEGLELWHKLAVLGVFCESLTGTLAKGGHASIPSLLDSFAAMVEQGLVLDALAELQPNHSVQALVFAVFWQQKKNATASVVQNKVFEAIAKGLGGNAETGLVTAEQLVDCYSRGVTRLPEALQAAPHLLEHYILNEMFCDLFPFHTASPYENYLQLISRFGLLRLMLAARCNTDGAVPDAAVLVQTVQVHCRRFQHDASFAMQVNQILKNSGWAKLEKIYGFLRT